MFFFSHSTFTEDFSRPDNIEIISIFFLIILLSVLTHIFVENPCRKLSLSRPNLFYGSSCWITILVLSFSIIFFNGFPERFLPILRTLKPTDFKLLDHLRHNECFLGILQGHGAKQDDGYHDESCIDRKKPLLALWGDSHAAALYPGLQCLEKTKGFGIAYLTQSACPPLFNLPRLGYRQSCNQTNERILDTLATIQPNVILIHAAWEHHEYPLTKRELYIKLDESIKRVRGKMPNAKIIIIGPVPRWNGSPKRELFREYLKTHKIPNQGNYIYLPAAQLQEIDSEFSIISLQNKAIYISAINALCKNEVCIATVGSTPLDYISSDYSHLTKAGSIYFINNIKNIIWENTAIEALH